MKIGPLGITEIIIILVVVLIIFGPKNLPKLGTAVGKAVKNLREGIGGKKKVVEATDEPEQVEEVEIQAAEKPKPAAQAAPAAEEPIEEVILNKPKPASASESEETKAE